ncbi:MAG TPA: N,N-dimethylformamidase beta subunit family domain-containing protein [Nitrososphaeraceae archaeon]|nr:N,N-dimethylformamidase beta subunit family domain-containing protein [Nitrososphaeraceae archaeon]
MTTLLNLSILAIILFIAKPALAANQDNNSVTPSINIIDPEPGATFVTGHLVVNGTSTPSDPNSDVKIVEVFVHGYPFNGNYHYENATQKISGNWSNWSFPLTVKSPGYYRIVAHALDSTGRENWTETTVNIPFIDSKSQHVHDKKKIALVDNTFTDAAYSPGAFYFFYAKHKDAPSGVNIKSDLNMLTAQEPDPPEVSLNRTIKAGDFEHLVDTSDPEKKHLIPLAKEIEKVVPNSLITVIRDEDIHYGRIFTSNGSNAFDALVLFHQEYMTQAGYDNLRHFVASGGKIIFIDGNIFYAQVDYDKYKRSITLLKGHDWEFNGQFAKKSIGERWFNENKQWMGSNFLLSEITDNIGFANNPFNYTHFEENFVTNMNDKIIYNYGAKIPEDNPYRGAIVATYELGYGKGKVIMFGIYAQNLASNKIFLEFFDKIIANYVL